MSYDLECAVGPRSECSGGGSTSLILLPAVLKSVSHSTRRSKNVGWKYSSTSNNNYYCFIIMSEIGARKKVVGSKVLHSQAREIIANVHRFMKREAENNGFVINVAKVQERVAEATGVSISSIKRVLSEEKTFLLAGNPREFSTPNKKRTKKKPITNLDDFDICTIRRVVNEFHKTKGERPTLRSILNALKEAIDFKGSKWALDQILKKLGYRWKNSINNRKVLIEKSDVREMRVRYLKTVKNYRTAGRPVVYMDETYVHSTHTKQKAWTDASGSGLQMPISKGNRLIIVHAGNEEGFIDNALLTFESGKKTGDYHNDMNYENYEKWLKNKLIPNLHPKSVVVIDNAPYHNKQINPAPISSSLKADMIKWLQERNIQFSDSMLKPELYGIIKAHKPSYKMFKIDGILAEAGHSVLRLPPYHPDLNPIEMVWALMKERLATKNISFSMGDVKELVVKICNDITKEDWIKRVDHCKKVEDEYLALEPHIDNLSEQFIINLGEDSTDDTCSSDTDSDLSGIEPL